MEEKDRHQSVSTAQFLLRLYIKLGVLASIEIYKCSNAILKKMRWFKGRFNLSSCCVDSIASFYCFSNETLQVNRPAMISHGITENRSTYETLLLVRTYNRTLSGDTLWWEYLSILWRKKEFQDFQSKTIFVMFWKASSPAQYRSHFCCSFWSLISIALKVE